MLDPLCPLVVRYCRQQGVYTHNVVLMGLLGLHKHTNAMMSNHCIAEEWYAWLRNKMAVTCVACRSVRQ